MARNVYPIPSLPGLPTNTGVSGRSGNSQSLPENQINPYDQLPSLKPVDSSWYSAELDRLNQLARQSAQQQAAFAQQSAQQYQDFASQYAQQRQDMMPQSRPRVSRTYILGGY